MLEIDRRARDLKLQLDREIYEQAVPLLALLPIVQTADPAQQVEHFPDSPPQRHDEKLLDDLSYANRLRDIESWIAFFTEYYRDYIAPMRGDEAALTWREDAAKIINATYWDVVKSDIRPRLIKSLNIARLDHHKIISITEIIIMKILPIEHPDREERAFLNALFASFVVTTVFGAFCPHLREFMNVSALKEFQNVSALKEFQRQHMIWLMNLNTSSENLPYFSNAATHYLFEITMIKMAEKVAEVVQSQDATIEAIAGLVEAKDMLTGKHVQRTKAYLRVLVDEMLRRGIYADVLTPEFADLVVRTAPLHDIGKIGVKDCILNKPGSHDEFERQVMKKHAAMGGKALEKAAEKTGSTEFLECAQQIAYYHHEWWNGSEKGYPGKFKGEDIPLCARLMAFADTYDAARFKRQYKPAKPHVDVVAEIDRDTGKQFDPAITPAFLAVARQFEEIAREFADDA